MKTLQKNILHAHLKHRAEALEHLAVDEAVFTAEVGKVIGPVKTDFGYHLIRVDELTGGEQSEFAEVYPQIMQQLTTEKQNKKYMAVRQEMIEKYGLEFK